MENRSAAPRIEHVQRLLQSRDELERVEGIQRLLQMGKQDWMVPLLLHLLEDPAWSVRCAAAGALGRLGDPRALSALERHRRWWREPSREVRRVVRLALEQLQASGLSRALIEVPQGSDTLGHPEQALALVEASVSPEAPDRDLSPCPNPKE